jgi:hypothetical protein
MGPFSTARHIEPFSLLVAQLAYYASDRPELGYRFERLDIGRITSGDAHAFAHCRRFPDANARPPILPESPMVAQSSAKI